MVGIKPVTESLPVERDVMHPILTVLYDYWTSLPAPGGLPEWGGALGPGFCLIDLPTNLLSILAVVDADPDGDAFTYRFWGTERRMFQGNRPDPTGETIAAGLPEVTAQDVQAQYMEMRRAGVPMLLKNTWPLDNGLSAECQTLRLPLSDGGHGIGKIVAATAFLRHADEFRRMNGGG